MYAENTSVPADRSRAEIEKVLGRFGATEFAYSANPERVVIAFRIQERAIRFTMPFPERGKLRTKQVKVARSRTKTVTLTDAQVEQAWERAHRARWRALLLVVKAKCEAVSAGVVSFESEFLAHVVVPGTGETVGEQVRKPLELAYANASVPGTLLLPGPNGELERPPPIRLGVGERATFLGEAAEPDWRRPTGDPLVR